MRNYHYGKLDENGIIEYAILPLPINNNTWTNNPDLFKECGYYPIQSTPMPEPEEGYYFTSHYELIDKVITLVWVKEEQPYVPPVQDPYELLDIISGETDPNAAEPIEEEATE